MSHSLGSLSDSIDGAVDTIRVLHVDDDEGIRDLASVFLERAVDSFEIISANRASDGLERLKAGGIDCVVSDYQMPDQNGLEFFDSIPDERSDTPFILFTGKGSEEVASDAFSLGVTDYLQKESAPDQFTVLANRILQAVSKSRAQRRFQTLVEESNDAIFIVGPGGLIRFATPATERILGISPETLVGTNGFDPIHPEDIDVVQEEFTKLIEYPGYRGQADFRYRHADGSWVWVEARGRNLIESNDIGGVVVYIRDINGRKENEQALERREQQFRAVFEGAFDAMVLADDEGVYVDANPAACELFGLEKDELLGRSIREFAPEDYDFKAAWREFQQSDRERGLFPLVRPDGERRVVEFAASHVLPNRHLSILLEVTGQERVDVDQLTV